MARKIKDTPILSGEDSLKLIEQLNYVDRQPKDTREAERLKEIYVKFINKGISL